MVGSQLRSLPRIFVPGASSSGPIPLPQDEIDKLRKVLRLAQGAEIAVLPNNGTVVRCRFEHREAVPIEVVRPETEAELDVAIAQALPKGDKLDEIVRTCTEIGVKRFVLFPSDRTVVKWDAKKTGQRLQRLETIAREASEISFRTRLPVFELRNDLSSVLEGDPDAVVLSESEGLARVLPKPTGPICLVVGPEGGWSPREMALIGDRGVTLGPRVLRVDHAAAAAASILLLAHD